MRCCQIQINVPNTISLARTGRTPVASVVVASVVEPVVLEEPEEILLRASTSAVSEMAEADSPASSKISLAVVVPVAVSKVQVLAALVASEVSAEEPTPAMVLVLISELAAAVAAATAAAVARVPEPIQAR